MLSDEEKREMLEDAQSKERREAFAKAHAEVVNQELTGPQYVQFLQSAQRMFPQLKAFKKIEGNMFKL